MQTIEQRISALEEDRSEKSERMKELFVDGEFANDEDKAEYRDLAKELKGLDEQLGDLRSYEQAIGTAKPVHGKSSDEGKGSRGGAAYVKKGAVDKDAAPGIRMARMTKVKALAYLDHVTVDEAAKKAYGPKADSVLTDIKADVSAGSTTQPGWATELVGTEGTAFADFAEYLRPMTILGKFGTGGVPSLRRVPFRTRLISQETGGSAYWVPEGAAKPLTKFTFDSRTLQPTKCATIAVLTEELIRDSSPSAEGIVRDQLAEALVAELDSVFIGAAGASGAQPAGILNTIAATTSEGPGVDDVRVDVRRLVEAFAAADNPPTSAVWVMRPAAALALSLMVNELGVVPSGLGGIGMNGGTFFGMPVITSNHIADGTVALINASDVYWADEGQVRIDMSREASLLMTNDSTTNMASTDGGSPDDSVMANVVSMWQTNSVAFRAERTVNWMRRRDGGVHALGSVNWGKTGSPLS